MTLSSTETGIVARRPASAQPRDPSAAAPGIDGRARFALASEPRETPRARSDAPKPREPSASEPRTGEARAARTKLEEHVSTRDKAAEAAARPARDSAGSSVKADPRPDPNARTAPPAPGAALAATAASAIAAEAGKTSAADAGEPGKEASKDASKGASKGASETHDEVSAGAAATAGPSTIQGLIPPPPPALQTNAQTASPTGEAAGREVAGQIAVAAKAEGVEEAGDGADAKAAEPGKPASERGFEAILSGGAIALPADLAAAPQPTGAPTAPGAAPPTSAPAEASASPAAPPLPPTPLGAVPITIGLRSLSGSSQFEIRLDPKDLGRIDVTLDIDRERGTVTTHLVVDRPETLALLQRDAGSLQQALSQTGLDPSEGGINLSLRGENPGGQSADPRDSGGRASGRGGDASALDADPRLSIDATPLRALRGPGGVDIRI